MARLGDQRDCKHAHRVSAEPVRVDLSLPGWWAAVQCLHHQGAARSFLEGRCADFQGPIHHHNGLHFLSEPLLSVDQRCHPPIRESTGDTAPVLEQSSMTDGETESEPP